MALELLKILTANSTDELETKIKTATDVEPLLLLYGPPQYNAGSRQWVQTLIKGTNVVAEGNGALAAADITDATATGVAVMTAVDAAAGRAALGAGTSNLVIGTTGTTAKAGNWTPALDDVGEITDAGKELVTQPNYTAMRALLDLDVFATATAAEAAVLLNLGALATLDTITASQITDAGDLATADGVTVAQITNAAAFMRTLLIEGVNEATVRNYLSLGQLAQLNEVTAAQISDGTITNSEISAAANIAASKLAGTNDGRALLGIAKQAAIPNIAVAPTAADYNAILQVLRNVGLIAP